MSWLSCLSATASRKPPGQLPGLGLGLVAERKAQHGELLACRGEQEIALVALFLAGAIERARAVSQAARCHVVAGGQHRGAELARGAEQIGELDRPVAVDARHRRFAGDIALRKAVDHRLLEAALVVEHVVRNADALGTARASWMSWPAQQAPLRWVAAP